MKILVDEKITSEYDCPFYGRYARDGKSHCAIAEMLYGSGSCDLGEDTSCYKDGDICQFLRAIPSEVLGDEN